VAQSPVLIQRLPTTHETKHRTPLCGNEKRIPEMVTVHTLQGDFSENDLALKADFGDK
jgi:hypothetical protein